MPPTTKPIVDGTWVSVPNEILRDVLVALISARAIAKFLETFEDQLEKDLSAELTKRIGIDRPVPPPARVPRSNLPTVAPGPVVEPNDRPGWQRALPKGWHRVKYAKGLRYHPSNQRWTGSAWVYVNPADLVAQPDDIVIQDGAGL